LLDGAIRFEDLFARCKQLGMDSVALTDHGNLFGVVEFYTKALESSIKPIIGMEAYVAPTSRHDKSKAGIAEAADHLILLAKDNTGYKNLMRLASIGYLEGFYYRPRIDKQVLEEFHQGLIGCSACLKGEVTAALAKGDMETARAAAEGYARIFGPDHFYLEVQRHQPQQVDIVGPTVDLANKLGLPVVATNDVHFLDAEDYEAHNCLCAIGTGKLATDPDRLIYPTSVYLKSPQQMRELFQDIQSACDATIDIAERCSVELDLKTRHAPRFKTPDGSTPEQFLTKIVYQGAAKRYGQITDQLRERIERELHVINTKGLASYFLIVWDFCEYGRSQKIRLGARGSGVGTVVGYCLGLSDVDPIKYDLLFERFIDPQRSEMPDIDIDICQVHRQQVIDYVRRKYGHVAQIITFGTMKARAVIRDICRVLGVPLAEADRLAKLVPASLDMTLHRALQTEPELAEAYQSKPHIRKVIDIGRKLEGLARHASVHAAGVVVSDEPLIDLIPLYRQPGSDDLITQFEGPMVEKVGLLKMDFLGLKTLSVLELARQLVKQNYGEDVDIDNLDLNDAKTFELFASGKTKGVFQFESSGMQAMLVKMRPDRIEDLIAANALYRPGPMVLIEDYIERKHGASWSCPHPIMTEILGETYGIMVYQEQVMRICNRLGDIPLRDAYKLIKAISKKQAEVIAKYRQHFIKGATQKELQPQQAEQIWEIIERFAGYGFNKSHSTRYAFVAYQTAYMKAHWPVEFMAALLTYETGDTDKVVEYIDECRAMGIEVLPPDINESGVWFTPLYQGPHRKGVIRFGLAAVKGVGEKAVEQIIQARQRVGRFNSIFDFCENVDLHAVNRQVIESLIKAGAFDRLGGSRAQLLAGLDTAMSIGAAVQSDRSAGQMNLFDGNQPTEPDLDRRRLPDVPAWSESQMLAYEKEVLGFYVTSNPLAHHAQLIDTYSTVHTSSLSDTPQDKEVVIGGIVAKVQYKLTKNGRAAGSKMAVLTLEDLQGQVEVVVFPSVLAQYQALIAEDVVIFVRGRVDHSRQRPNLLASEIIAVDEISKKAAAKVRIRLIAKELDEKKIAQIRQICMQHPGNSPIFLTICTERGKIHAAADKRFSVDPDVEFCNQIRQLVGQGNLLLTR